MESFASIEWISRLVKQLLKIREKRKRELTDLSDTFGNVEDLARHYIEPYVQHHNPADLDDQQEGARSQLVMPAFKALNGFLQGNPTRGGGTNQMFILSDAGMGKTSLLLMLKLMHLTEFWPLEYECMLLKLGDRTLDSLASYKGRSKTILLLDALDEDPLAWARLKERMLDILQASENFHRVLISCRTQFFPKKGLDPFDHAGRVEIGGYICPMYFLAPFDDEQVSLYLHKKFPKKALGNPFRKHSQQYLRAIPIVESMRYLRFRPLLLSHIEDLLASPGINDNEFKIYQSLINSWLMREERKLRDIGDYPNANWQLLKVACRSMAIEMNSMGKKIVSIDRLEKWSSVPGMKELTALDLGGRSLLNRNSDGGFRFSHSSIQEFLVAEAWNKKQIPYGHSIRLSSLIEDFIIQGNENGFYPWALIEKMKARGIPLAGCRFLDPASSKFTWIAIQYGGVELAFCLILRDQVALMSGKSIDALPFYLDERDGASNMYRSVTDARDIKGAVNRPSTSIVFVESEFLTDFLGSSQLASAEIPNRVEAVKNPPGFVGCFRRLEYDRPDDEISGDIEVEYLELEHETVELKPD